MKNDDDGSSDINSVLQISNEDLDRTPEKINIERNAVADTGEDDAKVIWKNFALFPWVSRNI